MNRPTMSRAGALTAGAVALGVLAGCGLGTAGGYTPSGELAGPVEGVELDGAALSVGSKDFTEQIVLGKMAVILLRSAGADVEDLTNIPGSNSGRESMLQGHLDLHWEYTGTAWINYLGNEDPIDDERGQYEAVRDADAANGLEWLEPAELNNTYAFAVNRETAQELGLSRISDLADLDEADRTFCLDAQFAARNDGFEPMLEQYGLPPVPRENQSLMDEGATYQAVADDVCTAAQVQSTDGRILALDLVLLEDDERYFPRYNASAVVHGEALAEHPRIPELMDPLTERLDDDTMTGLNARVDVEGEEPADVAWDFLVEEGFVSAG
uniref:glycine betaine ABC transporter substrate-binding protein n=1 Tax=Nocardiopsis salina TaxID=245836 RepID=UPI00036A73D5